MKSDNRAWIEAALAHREPHRVPYNFTFSPPARLLLEGFYGTGQIEEALNFPIRTAAPTSKKPLYAAPHEFGPTVTDEFGVVWSTSDIDRGSPIGPCLGEADLSSYRWPDPLVPGRFDGLPEWCERLAGNFRLIWVGDLWERATFMRGMEHLLLDLATNPSFVDALLDGLERYILRTMEVLIDACRFECIAISDDYGTQKGPLMSPAHWRRFVKPRLAAIYSLAKAHGLAVMHHSCGNILPIIPDMIDLGLDILHPVQPEAMDVRLLKREFGKSITLCGGVGTQQLLPHGTPDDVKAEIHKLKRDLGGGGGYILEPGITLQADVPLANMVAMIEAAREDT